MMFGRTSSRRQYHKQSETAGTHGSLISVRFLEEGPAGDKNKPLIWQTFALGVV